MPNGDYGIFTPTEAAYTRPGTYEGAVRAEATKRGTYLSAMDQFYAELEEMERQFGEKLAFEEKRLASEETRWEEELGWLREQETGRIGLEKERLQSQERVGRLAAKATRTGGAGAGRESIYGGAFEPFIHTSERKAQEQVSTDWLSQQLSAQRGEVYQPTHYV